MPDPNVLIAKRADLSRNMSAEEAFARRSRINEILVNMSAEEDRRTPLSEYSDAELQSELSKRRADRARDLSEKRKDHFEKCCLRCRYYSSIG